MVELIQTLEDLNIPFEISSTTGKARLWPNETMDCRITYGVGRTVGVDHLYFDGPADAMKAWAIATDMWLKCQLIPLAQDDYALMVFMSYSD